jgi:hypothetical protein
MSRIDVYDVQDAAVDEPPPSEQHGTGGHDNDPCVDPAYARAQARRRPSPGARPQTDHTAPPPGPYDSTEGSSR